MILTWLALAWSSGWGRELPPGAVLLLHEARQQAAIGEASATWLKARARHPGLPTPAWLASATDPQSRAWEAETQQFLPIASQSTEDLERRLLANPTDPEVRLELLHRALARQDPVETARHRSIVHPAGNRSTPGWKLALLAVIAALALWQLRGLLREFAASRRRSQNSQ